MVDGRKFHLERTPLPSIWGIFLSMRLMVSSKVNNNASNTVDWRKFSDLASSKNARKSKATSVADFLHVEPEVNFVSNSRLCVEQGQLPASFD